MTAPFTPETLARRWGVSATSIRNKCQSGELRHFRFGKLYRIPAAVVEEIEACSPTDAPDAASASADEPIIIRHAPERKRNARVTPKGCA